jgi:phosphoribosylformylglycinamidine (FGAM) synthase-like enzyme
LVPLLPPNTPGTTSIDQLPQLILTTLTTYSSKNGLGLAPVDLSYLASHYSSHLASLEPKPATFELSESDAFLFMFSQVQSEHCRHHVFRSTFSFPLAKEGVSEEQDKSLFDMIRNTHLLNPHGTKSAYSDNAAVLEGPESVKGRMWRKQGEKKEGTGGREWFVMEGEGTDVVAKVRLKLL